MKILAIVISFMVVSCSMGAINKEHDKAYSRIATIAEAKKIGIEITFYKTNVCEKVVISVPKKINGRDFHILTLNIGETEFNGNIRVSPDHKPTYSGYFCISKELLKKSNLVVQYDSNDSNGERFKEYVIPISEN